jgi:hypothetical protein
MEWQEAERRLTYLEEGKPLEKERREATLKLMAQTIAKHNSLLEKEFPSEEDALYEILDCYMEARKLLQQRLAPPEADRVFGPVAAYGEYYNDLLEKTSPLK